MDTRRKRKGNRKVLSLHGTVSTLASLVFPWMRVYRPCHRDKDFLSFPFLSRSLNSNSVRNQYRFYGDPSIDSLNWDLLETYLDSSAIQIHSLNSLFHIHTDSYSLTLGIDSFFGVESKSGEYESVYADVEGN